MKYDKVIVFGPTGGVGSQTALEASKRGGHVYLAMRDPNKPIPLLKSVESGGQFTRIQADLSKPDSCGKVVKDSGAKAAYIYHIPGPDGMKASITAMKEAGLEFAVFLSSFSILLDHDIRNMDPKDIISSMHAKVECNLEDVRLKDGFVALRCGNFATNIAHMKLDKSTTPWTAHELYSDTPADAITPIDMGRVSGALLTNPPDDARGVVYCLGPKLLTHSEQWDIVKRVTGKQIDVINHDQNPAGYANRLKSLGLPPMMADNLVEQLAEVRDGRWYKQYDGFYDDVRGNVKKYSGYEPTSFEKFVADYEW